MKKHILIFLFLILLIGGFLRFFQLGAIPSSLDWDEVALGYNAYSILHTGKDEFGKQLPFVLQSFGDYKPALYTYLTIPSIMVFGLTPFAVRFPSALFGTLTIVLVYFLVRKLFSGEKYQISFRNISFDIPLLTTFLFAVTPWHIQFSRAAFESNVGLFFNLAGIVLFLYGLKNSRLLFITALSFAASIYTYQSEKVFVPLLLGLLVILFFKEIQRVRFHELAAGIFLLVLLLPMLHFTLFDERGLARAKGASIVQSPKSVVTENHLLRGITNQENNDTFGMIFDNRRTLYVKAVVENYLSHFNLKWLFIKGDFTLRHQPPGMGHLYLVALPFFLIGLYILLFGQFQRRTKILLFGWFLITPLGASITWDVPNAVRTLNFLPLFQIFIALGIIGSITWCMKREYLKRIGPGVIAIFILCLFLFNIAYYLNQYFRQYNYFASSEWQYGYDQAIEAVQQHKADYERVIVSNEKPLDQSQIFFLFYLQYSPKELHEAVKKKVQGVDYAFGEYVFKHVDFGKDAPAQKTLYVLPAEKHVPSEMHTLQVIHYENGEPAIKIVAL